MIDPVFDPRLYEAPHAKLAWQQQSSSAAATAADCSQQQSVQGSGLGCSEQQVGSKNHEEYIQKTTYDYGLEAADAGGSSRRVLQQAANTQRLQKPYNVCVSPLQPLVTCKPDAEQKTYSGDQAAAVSSGSHDHSPSDQDCGSGGSVVGLTAATYTTWSLLHLIQVQQCAISHPHTVCVRHCTACVCLCVQGTK
jgi:hypothetical protein